MFRLGTALLFVAGVMLYSGMSVGQLPNGYMLVVAAMISDTDTFVWLMLAALLAAAIWLNIATAIGAPVSTTHSIVGGVLGAGIASGGMDIANWGKMGQIAASWIISPMMGGIIAAAFLYFIKHTVTYRGEKMAESAGKSVPILVGVMAWAFSTYLVLRQEPAKHS